MKSLSVFFCVFICSLLGIGQEMPSRVDSASVDSLSQDSISVQEFDSSKYYYLDEDSIIFSEIVQLTPVLIFHKQYPTLKEQSQFNRTKRRILKVWPYYITALKNIAEVDLSLIDVKRRRKRKRIVKKQQKELRLEFEDELRNLTVTEGKILVKMIERKTGMPFYDLIQQYRGTLQAFKWNTLAFALGYSLRDGYSPEEWEYVEVIMNAIESN